MEATESAMVSEFRPKDEENGSDMRSELLSAARAWAAGRGFAIRYPDYVDDAYASLETEIRRIVRPGGVRNFCSSLRIDASSMLSVVPGPDGSVRHRLRRDLFLMPAVGSYDDVASIVRNPARRLALSEFVRRSSRCDPVEDVLLLPMVLDAVALARPSLRGIRAAVEIAVECFDAEDAPDDDGIEEAASRIAELLGARIVGSERDLGDDGGCEPLALVGFSSRRRSVASPDASHTADTRGDAMWAFYALGALRGPHIDLAAPASWPCAATTVASMFLRFSLRRRLRDAGLPAESRVSELRHATPPEEDDVAFAAVVDGRVLGPIIVPVWLANQDIMRFKEECLKVADRLPPCAYAELMAPPPDRIPEKGSPKLRPVRNAARDRR